MHDPLADAAAAAELVTLPLARIREPDQVLRGPERHDPRYAELRDSIREKGVLVPVLVRPDPARGDYILVDGMQRLTISRETGRRTIPARVLSVAAAEALEIQIIANLHRVETTPVRYAEQLRLMMVMDPGLTAPKLAVKLDKSPTWVYGMLGLVRLAPAVRDAVEAGEIPLANASALAKLPEREQAAYLPLAREQQPPEFVPRMTGLARRLKESGREGRGPKEYVQVDHFQKMRAVKEEITRGDVRRALFREAKGKITPERAWRLALEWVLHRDAISQRAAREKEARLLGERGRVLAELDREAEARRLGRDDDVAETDGI
jgi:ParB/RepB/Spo0J family partition protein